MDRRLGDGIRLFIPGGLAPEFLVDRDVRAGVEGLLKGYGSPTFFEATPGDIGDLAARVAARGGAAGILTTTRGERLWREVVSRRVDTPSLQVSSRHAIIPSFGNPRWFIPITPEVMRSLGFFVKPSRLLPYIIWIVCRMFVRLTGSFFLFRNRLIVLTTEEGEEELAPIREITAVAEVDAPVRTSLYTGSYGFFQKFTVLLARGSTAVGFAKVGTTRHARERIEAEANALEELNRLRFERLLVPSILGRINRPGYSALLQDALPGQPRSIQVRLRPEHVDGLAELFMAGDGVCPTCSFEDWVGFLRSQAAEFPADKRSDLSRLLVGALDRVERNTGDTSLPVGLLHGDFTPWNVNIVGDRLYVFDWELMRWGPAAWDLFNFVVHSDILVRARAPEAVVCSLICPSGRYGGLVQRYWHSILPTGSQKPEILLDLYLAESALNYLKELALQASGGLRPKPEDQRLLRGLRGMLFARARGLGGVGAECG